MKRSRCFHVCVTVEILRLASALSQLDELEAKHRWAELLHADVERIGVKYLSEGSLSSQEVERFRTDNQDLRSMYERHIRLEDHIIFPLAARALIERDRSEIADEMARRRKVKLGRYRRWGAWPMNGRPSCSLSNAQGVAFVSMPAGRNPSRWSIENRRACFAGNLRKPGALHLDLPR